MVWWSPRGPLWADKFVKLPVTGLCIPWRDRDRREGCPDAHDSGLALADGEAEWVPSDCGRRSRPRSRHARPRESHRKPPPLSRNSGMSGRARPGGPHVVDAGGCEPPAAGASSATAPAPTGWRRAQATAAGRAVPPSRAEGAGALCGTADQGRDETRQPASRDRGSGRIRCAFRLLPAATSRARSKSARRGSVPGDRTACGTRAPGPACWSGSSVRSVGSRKPGDVRPAGEGVSELRIGCGPATSAALSFARRTRPRPTRKVPRCARIRLRARGQRCRMTVEQSQPTRQPWRAPTCPDSARRSSPSSAWASRWLRSSSPFRSTSLSVRTEFQSVRAEIQAVRDELRDVRAEAHAERQAIRAEARADREAMRAAHETFQNHILRLTEQQGIRHKHLDGGHDTVNAGE